MLYVILALVVLVSLVGGAFYGYSYLKAKANKKPVSTVIVENLDDLMKPNV